LSEKVPAVVFIEVRYRNGSMLHGETGHNGTKSAKDGDSRKELLDQLRSAGIKTEFLENCTLEQLQNLASGKKWLDKNYGADDSDDDAPIEIKKVVSSVESRSATLTTVDKKMLQTLLASSGRVSSLALSRKLEIPLTTIQRRRKRLESEFLEVAYSLKLEKLGWRNADLLISTSKGTAASIGKELLTHNSITRVCRSIGEHTIDLHAEIVFKNNTELLNVIEWIKSLDGVKDVVWTEPVELMGKNIAGPLQILDQLKT
jgi:DNA-binding Lrp family transcriptional regulator